MWFGVEGFDDLEEGDYFLGLVVCVFKVLQGKNWVLGRFGGVVEYYDYYKKRYDRIYIISNVQNVRYLEEFVDCFDFIGILVFSGVRVVVGEIERQWFIIVVIQIVSILMVIVMIR